MYSRVRAFWVFDHDDDDDDSVGDEEGSAEAGDPNDDSDYDNCCVDSSYGDGWIVYVEGSDSDLVLLLSCRLRGTVLNRLEIFVIRRTW